MRSNRTVRTLTGILAAATVAGLYGLAGAPHPPRLPREVRAAALPAVEAAASANSPAIRVSPPPSYPTQQTSGVPAGIQLQSWPWALRTSAAGNVPTEVRNGRTCQVFDSYSVSMSGGQYFIVDTACAIFRRSRFTTSGTPSNGSALVLQSSANKFLEIGQSSFDGGPQHVRNLQADHADLEVTASSFTRFGNAAVEMNNRSSTASLYIADSWIYEPKGWPREVHADGIQVGGAKNVTLLHNTVLVEPYGGTNGDRSYVSNAAIAMWPFFAGIPGTVTIEGNLLGGGGMVMYLSDSNYSFTGSLKVRWNVFSTSMSANSGLWGVLYPTDVPTSRLTWESNSWDTGEPLPLYDAM